MSTQDADTRRPYRETKLLKDWEPEIITPLPLPGEYVVLQLNPAAMAKHVADENFIKELRKLQTKKYLAVCAGYYEGVSDLKTWHMMHALLFMGEGEEEVELPTQDPSLDWDAGMDEPTNTPKAPVAPRPRQMKRVKTRIVENICVRIRTRLCSLPRTQPTTIPEEIYSEMVTNHVVASDDFAYTDTYRIPRTECRGFTLVRGPKTPTQDNLPPASQGKYDPAEWDAAPKPLQLCLLPHCDYSLDVDQETSLGTEFMDEHAQIIAMMRSAIPEMPLKAVLPVHYVHPSPSDYYVERQPDPRWENMGLTQVPDFILQRSERARRRAEMYNHRQTWCQRFFHPEKMYWPTREVAILQKMSEGIEILTRVLVVRAPADVLEGKVVPRPKSSLSWRERLADAWADLRIAASLMFWIPPDYPEPLDEEPHIPYATWDELSKKGEIKRWETTQEFFDRMRSQAVVDSLTGDDGM